MPILDTARWPGARNTYYDRDISQITGVTLHYTAGSPNATPQDIAEYQISDAAADQTGVTPRQPFPAIAYHFYIDGAGTVYYCNDIRKRVWHSGAVVNGISRNASHIGICYGGDYAPSSAQITGMGYAISLCERDVGRALTIEGHRDAPYPTACPGSEWPSWRGKLPIVINQF